MRTEDKPKGTVRDTIKKLTIKINNALMMNMNR
jgi:hypothetical protein